MKSNVNTKLQKAASKAAREILELFNARNKRLSGQNGKMDNEAKEMFKIQDPLNDDKIIQACLQLRKDGKHVQLVSFDNILKIKAHSYQIEIFQTNKLQSVQVAAKKRAAPVVSIFSPILRIAYLIRYLFFIRLSVNSISRNFKESPTHVLLSF